MRKKINLLLVVTIIACMLLSGCKTDKEHSGFNRWSAGDNLIVVMEDSYIAVDYEARAQGDYLIYRYYRCGTELCHDLW